MKPIAASLILLLIAPPALALEPMPTCGPGKLTSLDAQTRKEEPNPFELLDSEAIDGWLTIGLPARTVLEQFAPNPIKGDPQFWGALGAYVQPWRYPNQGLGIDMISERVGSEQEILSVTIQAPSTATTARGIGIGSTWAEVEAAYGDEREYGTAGGENIFVAGSIYGGVIFFFDAEERVTEIFLGAGAE